MKFLKWGLVFGISFVVSFVVIMTFSQKSFREPVPAKIFNYETPSVPIYYYIGGAFCCGLLIGVGMVTYNFFVHTGHSMQKSKRIRQLERENEELRRYKPEQSATEEEADIHSASTTEDQLPAPPEVSELTEDTPQNTKENST